MPEKSKKIYLDVCALCRPFDDQAFLRIRLETDAVNLILAGIKTKKYGLVSSPVHYKEIKSISSDIERIEIITLLDSFGKQIPVNPEKVRQRADELVKLKFGTADAAHIAFSEAYKAIFISCDDRLIKKCQRHNIKIKCVNPILFCEMENLK